MRGQGPQKWHYSMRPLRDSVPFSLVALLSPKAVVMKVQPLKQHQYPLDFIRNVGGGAQQPVF